MASISVRTFRTGDADYPKDGYLDIWFVDNSPNAICRLWLLNLDLNGEWPTFRAELRRSRTAHDDLLYIVEAPRRIAHALLAAAIRDGLIPRQP